MDNNFSIQLEFNFYDIMMMAQAIAHARRYGDNQLSDWAADLRDCMNEKAGGKPSAFKVPSDSEQSDVDKDAAEALDKVLGDKGSE